MGMFGSSNMLCVSDMAVARMEGAGCLSLDTGGLLRSLLESANGQGAFSFLLGEVATSCRLSAIRCSKLPSSTSPASLNGLVDEPGADGCG